jgi:hypothetical protein
MIEIVLKSVERTRCRVISVKSTERCRFKEACSLTSEMFAVIIVGKDFVGGRKDGSCSLTIYLAQLLNVGQLLRLDVDWRTSSNYSASGSFFEGKNPVGERRIILTLMVASLGGPRHSVAKGRHAL